MKPRSPGVDPPQSKKLAVKMKTQLKVKSPEIFPKTTRKGTLINQMTSTSNKRFLANSNPASAPTLKQPLSVSENDISGISPIKTCDSHGSLLSLTPKIVISLSSKQETRHSNSKVSPKKVLRSKVRSPVNVKSQRTIGGRDAKSSSKEVSRVKFEELENQLRKKTSECLNMNRKINALQKTLTEKDQTIRDLEIKFPKMLSELKKGFGEDESKKKVNKELKETMKRNRQLSGAQKQTEDQLKIKDDKLKQALKAKDVALDELKVKEKESKEFLGRLSALEKSFPELVMKLSEKESDVRRSNEMVSNLEQRLKIVTDDNILKMRSIDQVSDQVVDLNNNVLEKEAEIVYLKQNVYELQVHKRDDNIKVKRLEFEKSHLQKLVEQVRGPIEPTDIVEEGVNFDEATEDFLDKVSAVSKEQNVTVNLKLTVKKSRVSNIFDQSRVHSGRNSLKTLTEENNYLSRLDESNEEYPDEVFDNLIDFAENMSVGSIEDVSNIIEDSNMSEEEYDVSAGTINRAEELDTKVREMWAKLSTRDQTFEELRSDRTQFTSSVSRLETDLNESIQQHNRFLDQVSVAKKLFD